METVAAFIFLDSKSLQMAMATMKLKELALGRKAKTT